MGGKLNMKKDYEINSSTLAILAVDNKISKVIEEEEEFLVTESVMKIIDKSCKFFGSSYYGRFEGTKHLLGISYKSPIIIEETKNIIFFPTTSPRIDECSWISLNNINTYKKNKNKSNLIFSNGYKLELDISYNILENQILRATRLDSILRKRKIGE